MKKVIFISVLILLNAVCAWGIQRDKGPFAGRPEGRYADAALETFRQNIPPVARQFIGTPYEYGGNPESSGTSDNSYLFFSIYSRTAQLSGLEYHGYLPMQNLLENTRPISENQIQNGDLMVLNDQLAAMIFHIEDSGRLHLIYASEKRNEVITFHSDNLVFYSYWLENLQGFFRLNDDMLK
ncbi:MAG: peptidoglycan endopeptidase [Desulfotignum sp.]